MMKEAIALKKGTSAVSKICRLELPQFSLNIGTPFYHWATERLQEFALPSDAKSKPKACVVS
jgi:hypothetical protein